MKAGLALNIAGDPERHDADILIDHIRLGDMAEPLGFGSIFAFEHHFSDYLISPCPFSLLSYFAGRTTKLLLGSSVIVLPWHDPIKVAERIMLLDILSNQRAIFGLGMGRALSEFDAFGVDRDERVTLWTDGLHVIRNALEGKPVASTGAKDDAQPIQVRPRRRTDTPLRLFAPASGLDSAARVMEAGLGLMLSADLPDDELINIGDIAAGTGGHDPLPRPILFAPVFVAESRAEGEDIAGAYLERDLRMAAQHYGSGPVPAALASAFIDRQIIGTPASCLERIRFLQQVTGSDHMVFEVSYGSMPHHLAEANLQRVGAELLPVLREW